MLKFHLFVGASIVDADGATYEMHAPVECVQHTQNEVPLATQEKVELGPCPIDGDITSVWINVSPYLKILRHSELDSRLDRDIPDRVPIESIKCPIPAHEGDTFEVSFNLDTPIITLMEI